MCCCLLSSWLTQGLGELDDGIVVRLVSLGCALGRGLGCLWSCRVSDHQKVGDEDLFYDCRYLSALLS